MSSKNVQVAEKPIRMRGECLVEIHDAKTGRLKYSRLVKNLFVSSGKASIAQALRGNTTNNNGQITYCAVGTGTNIPAANDTQLQTEVDRKQVSVRTSTDNIAQFQTFFNQSEAIGVLREAGLFGGLATDTINSGTLFSRLNINRTKTANDTLTLTWSIYVG